ncbi:MAG: cyclic nucleotide-binding domain-containing protein [Actinomycetota bacterium]
MAEFFINVAFVFYVGSAWLKQEMWLRITLMASSLCSTIFGILIGSPGSIVWNILFMLSTSVRVYQLWREQQPIELTREQEEMHRVAFSTLDRREFLRVWNTGAELTFHSAPLMVEHRSVDRLALILDGEASVTLEGVELARLDRGSFAGEMAFATGVDASATVRPDGPVRAMVWSTGMLRDLVAENPDLSYKLERVISGELVAKLIGKNQVAAEASQP